MKRKTWILFAAIGWMVIMSESIKAQETYTLQQCKEIALKQSLQLKADSLDLEHTHASIKQAYSSVLPSININGSYQYSPEVQANIIPSETFGGAQGSYMAARLGVPQTKSATAELTQTIYNQSAFIALKVAKNMTNLDQLQVRSSQEDLVYNVSATYYNIQYLMKQEELNTELLNNTEALLKGTQEQLMAGLATQTDVDRLTVSRDNTKASLETLRNNKTKYYNLLKVLMNIPLDQVISIEGFKDNEVGAIPTMEYNGQEKTNYLQQMQRKDVLELEYKNIQAGHLPTLSFYANYGLYGYYSDANPFKNINDRFYSTSSLGIRLKIPVFDGLSTKYQAQQKRIDISKNEIKAQQILQQNEREVADAYADLQSNLITYENQKRNLALAQKVMTDINQQYQSGIARVTDVINTSTDLQTAQNNYVNALINLKQAEISLKKAQGTLLH